ncbi:enoyl-CoA hydratase-related protein, partial [Nocardia cyriacigeorgica]|uniref:enoyl-CoA hydratase-related protein n=1 Tax=Nocardia cyriacigeorgica TaxID=135487 RepID=UPI0024558044
MSSELLVDVSAGIAVLTLNRPAQQNAFTPAMIAELSAALQRCDIEDAIRVVVITGTPPPVCAGADRSDRDGAVTRHNAPPPFPVWLGGVLVFGARRPILVRLVVPSEQLLAWQRRVHALVAPCPG